MMPDTPEPLPRPIDDDSVERITRFNEGAIQGLPADLQDQYVSVQSEGIEPSYLLIYAEKERDDALKLHEALADHLAAGGCHWQMRDWHQVPIGERHEETRRVWLQEARFVLLLLSVGLIADLNRRVIVLETKRPLLPLAFKEFTSDKLEGTALADHAIFADQGKAWNRSSGAGRDAWAGRAAHQILAHIQAGPPRHDAQEFFSLPHLRRADDCDNGHYVTQLVKGPYDLEGRPAIDFLMEWLSNPEADVFCAIFGELGMGKTTLCQRLTQVLLERRSIEANVPLPVYLDLRAVNTMGWDWSRGVPELELLLDHLMGSEYRCRVGQILPSADQIARLAQEQRGLILFDGLDEVMNRLTPDQCHIFIHRLWDILPRKTWKRPAGAPKDWRRPAGVGRLVMTCRSHFFQTIQDQLSALDGQQRQAVTRKDYLWVTLLPFSRDQVETYFRQVFRDDPDRAERVLAMLDQVHDLRELGSRPYNLRLIQDQIEALETIQRQGGRVDIADLYDGMVGEWTQRDRAKHRLSRDHKLLLMERLALRLWSRQQGDLPYADLDTWLMHQIRTEPGWKDVEYRSYLSRDGGIDILKEDLRNATFIVLEGDDRFRFAHTSIMEFFLARALHRALLEDRLEDWTLSVPSRETLDFLGGLIGTRETAICLSALASIRAGYRLQISELAVAYALHAHARNLPGADCIGFQLQGAELRFVCWQGREDQPLCWQGADFSGARLNGGRFTDCDLTGAQLAGADLRRTVFDRCRLDQVQAHGADLAGAVFHRCPANGVDFTGARFYHSQWLGPLPAGIDVTPPDLFTATLADARPDARPGSITGQRAGVTCMLVDPQGHWLASAAADGSVRLWDPVSGQMLHALGGHRHGVVALAVAPGMGWLAAACSDGWMRLWDSATGRQMYEMAGNLAGVLTLAVAPDGRWLASAGKDGRVHVWDPANRRLLHGMDAHIGFVTALIVAPDGGWLASGGSDGRVRLWDPVSGGLRREFEDHGRAVRALAVAQDGGWLVAADEGGGVHLWDAASGGLVRKLKGQLDGVRVLTIAPDGRWLAAVGRDGRVYCWNPAIGQFPKELTGCHDEVQALTVAADGRWIATAGGDGTVRLWDPASAQMLCTFGECEGLRDSMARDEIENCAELRRDSGFPGGETRLEHLPEGNWVLWHDPEGPNRRWVSWSGDAWRWLGWHAPLPDGEHWMYYPMDAFRAGPDPGES